MLVRVIAQEVIMHYTVTFPFEDCTKVGLYLDAVYVHFEAVFALVISVPFVVDYTLAGLGQIVNDVSLARARLENVLYAVLVYPLRDNFKKAIGRGVIVFTAVKPQHVSSTLLDA